MRKTCLLICSFLLLSCQTSPEPDYISRGDVISLNKSLAIPKLRSHITIQYGEIADEADLNVYEHNSIIENRELGPKTIQPESYTVSKVTYNEEWYSDAGAIIRYFTEIYLNSDNSQQQDLILSCQILGNTMEHHSFTADEIKQVTGGYFNF